jgi:hypothetical protein
MEYIKKIGDVFSGFKLFNSIQQHIEEVEENIHFFWCYGGEGGILTEQVAIKPMQHQCLL